MMRAFKARVGRNVTQANLADTLVDFTDGDVVKLINVLLHSKQNMGVVEGVGAELLRILALPGLYAELERRLELQES